MIITSTTRLGLAGLLASCLLAAPALAQVAPGVGVGAGGASAGLGGGGTGTINTTGAGTGMSAPATAGSTDHALNSNPAALPGFGSPSPGLVNPAPNGGITPPVGYNPGRMHHGMTTRAGSSHGATPPR